ncbi:MAG TPA: cation diffusion facilitator family transporter [Mycobacteriales bacterium]|nr:cation diffusion facilitator family transporter [Mycobacteriales bacterium]
MHEHQHSHGPATLGQQGRLAWVFAITLTLVAVEVTGGLLSGSLALLADAGHLGTDAAGIGLSLLAAWFAARPATPRRTFGWQRAEILAAAGNALLLFAIAGYVLYEGVQRLTEPPDVSTGLMAATAAVALVGNGIGLLLLRSSQRDSLNARAAFLEVASDALGALAVLVAALVIVVTGQRGADAVAAIAVGVLILPRTWRLLREAGEVLLEATPKDVDLAEVRSHILGTPGVLSVHDLHAWTITSGMPVLSAHVVVDDSAYADCGAVLDRLGGCLTGHFDVAHSTFQLEPAGHSEHEGQPPGCW